jgi:hypothetical protein
MKAIPFRLLAGTCWLLLAAPWAWAQISAMPKVMSDAPGDKGSWRMEPLQVPGRDVAQLKTLGGMTLCMTAAEAMARDRQPGPAGQPKRDEPKCTPKVIEDSASKAVMEVRCEGEDPLTMKNTITRVAPRSYEIESISTSVKRPQPQTTKVRMSYAGACSASDAAIAMDKASPQCAKMKEAMAKMDPAKCKAGQGQEACVQQMTAMRSQMMAMCK